MAFTPAKSQVYVADGMGRDSYIYTSNGGFSPERSPTKVHELGKSNKIFTYSVLGSFVVQKSQPTGGLA